MYFDELIYRARQPRSSEIPKDLQTQRGVIPSSQEKEVYYDRNCVICGVPLENDGSPAKREMLDAFLQLENLTGVDEELALFGVLHDGHMEMLGCFTEKQRRAIFWKIPGMNPVDNVFLQRAAEDDTYFGQAEGEDTWKLVRFLRYFLPSLN
jgi:hypothetical protein